MHARPAGPTLLQRPGRQTYGKGSVLHGTGPSFPSAALSSPTRILLVHERGDHAPQPLHGGIPMSALVPDELRNPFLRTLLGKRQNPEFIRARDFTRKRLGTGQAEVGTPHHLHGAEEVRRFSPHAALRSRPPKADASIALSTQSGPVGLPRICAQDTLRGVSAPASSNLRASE